MPVIPTLGRLKQEDCEFQDSLGYVFETLSQKRKKLSLTPVPPPQNKKSIYISNRNIL
jgi:hypothetical protein